MHGVNKYSCMCLIGLTTKLLGNELMLIVDCAVNHNLTSQLNIKGNKDIR